MNYRITQQARTITYQQQHIAAKTLTNITYYTHTSTYNTNHMFTRSTPNMKGNDITPIPRTITVVIQRREDDEDEEAKQEGKQTNNEHMMEHTQL